MVTCTIAGDYSSIVFLNNIFHYSVKKVCKFVDHVLCKQSRFALVFSSAHPTLSTEMIDMLIPGGSFDGQLVYDEGPFELMPREILPDNLSPVSIMFSISRQKENACSINITYDLSVFLFVLNRSQKNCRPRCLSPA
jgi:hypothetical protein